MRACVVWNPNLWCSAGERVWYMNMLMVIWICIPKLNMWYHETCIYERYATCPDASCYVMFMWNVWCPIFTSQWWAGRDRSLVDGSWFDSHPTHEFVSHPNVFVRALFFELVTVSPVHMPVAHITRGNVAALSTHQVLVLLAWLIHELASRFHLVPMQHDRVSMDVSDPVPGTPPASSVAQEPWLLVQLHHFCSWSCDVSPCWANGEDWLSSWSCDLFAMLSDWTILVAMCANERTRERLSPHVPEWKESGPNQFQSACSASMFFTKNQPNKYLTCHVFCTWRRLHEYIRMIW